MNIARTAFNLAEAGFAVIPVGENKMPYGKTGLKAATKDPYYAEEWFEKTRAPYVGIVTGRSGIVVLDLDYKENEDGTVAKDGFESLAAEWLEVPESFSYPSLNGKGKHIMYRAPEGVNLSRKSDYRQMHGVDRQAGESYVVFTADSIPEIKDLAPAPEWLLDVSEVRSAAAFEGDVRDWFDTLEPGEPSLIVRSAMARAAELFKSKGDDLSHSDIVEKQHEAVRLGAEGHPGVPELLALLEDLTMNRTGSHSRTPEEYAYEFAEALASGIQKHGAAISLRAELPVYSLNIVPASVPDRLVTGDQGDRDVFRELLAELIRATEDDLLVTSVLWNSPRTKDLAREWGLEFVHRRVQDARQRPEPVRENPTIPAPDAPAKEVVAVAPGGFLRSDEAEQVRETDTFITRYLAADASKGFSNDSYATPAAWTALSMAFGLKAVIPKGVNLGVNLWFMPLGYSGTGKSASHAFLKHVLDHLLNDGEGYYNLGALSSPEGILLELLTRDNKPSMIFQDEAASFFEALRSKDWMKTLEYDFSNYYMGDVPPSNKLSLKEFRGKGASTSFNIYMIATPDRLLKLINTDMFATGFMARYNYVWAAPPVETDDKYKATRSENDNEKNAPTVTFELAADLAHAGSLLKKREAVWGTDEAVARLAEAHKEFDKAAKSHEKYDALEPAITRLGRETLWKCAALLALYRGETTFTLTDALLAIQHGTVWYEDLIRVVEATSESEFSADASEIEAYIKSQGGEVTETKLNYRFRNMIRNSPRELEDRIGFLRVSGRILRVDRDKRVYYALNGTAD